MLVKAEEFMENYNTPKRISDLIGKKVNYSANGVDDWQIFYKNENGVYIITEDYINWNSKDSAIKATFDTIKANTGLARGDTDYSVHWRDRPTVLSTISDDIKTKFMYEWNESEETNIICISKLLDSNIWSSFASGNDKNGNILNNCKAIGSPTAEMWILSWNLLYAPNGPKDSAYLYLTAVENKGYQINQLSVKDVSKMIGYPSGENEKNVFFPDKTKNKSYGYWLASPGIDGKFAENMQVLYNGKIAYRSCSGGDNMRYLAGACRPVVYIPSSDYEIILNGANYDIVPK